MATSAIRARARGYDLRVADLASLRELHTWMRAEGILYARCGDLELRLEPKPAQVAAPAAEVLTADESELRDFQELLHSTGVDPAPFLAMRRATQ